MRALVGSSLHCPALPSSVCICFNRGNKHTAQILEKCYTIHTIGCFMKSEIYRANLLQRIKSETDKTGLLQHRKSEIYRTNLLQHRKSETIEIYRTDLFGQLRASCCTVCLQMLHTRVLLPLSISLFFLILLYLPFVLISLGGCMTTSLGIFVPMKDLYSHLVY
jgi:hypothetical protein